MLCIFIVSIPFCIEKKTDKNYAGIRVAGIVQSVSIVGIVQLLDSLQQKRNIFKPATLIPCLSYSMVSEANGYLYRFSISFRFSFAMSRKLGKRNI